MAETIARLLAVLIGFAVAMLGLIYAIHSQDIYLGILIMVGGIASMHMGLPSWIMFGVMVRIVILIEHKTGLEVARATKY